MDKGIVKEKLRLAISDMSNASMIECELRNIISSGTLVDAVRMACIITYARPFTKSKASNGTPKKWLKHYDDDIKEFLYSKNKRLFEVHNLILAERNQLVAHPDFEHHKVHDNGTCHSLCFKSYTHSEFNEVNLLMENFFKTKLGELNV